MSRKYERQNSAMPDIFHFDGRIYSNFQADFPAFRHSLWI